MKIFSSLGGKFEYFYSYSCKKLSCFSQSCQSRPICLLFRFVVFHVKPVWALFTYLIVGSLVGYLALKVSKPRTTSFRPRDLDVFFTSVSAITVSSMSTVEMEVFSNTQLIIMIILMFIGGELFTSMLGLQLARSKLSGNPKNIENRVGSTAVVVSQTSPIHNNFVNRIELGLVTSPQLENDKPETDVADGLNSFDSVSLKYNSIVTLAYVAFAYILTVVAIGSGIVSAYMSLVPSARRILKNKGLDIQTFSVFTTVSSFTNCGFIPTNENMIIFKGNPGLLLLLIPQILMGNTLYPPCLLFLIWVLKKTTKRPAFGYLLSNCRDMGYNHLFSGPRAALLVVTAFGFILIQFALFCSMEWNSGALDGLNAYQKLASSLFQVVNTRHAGENAFDFSIIAPAIRVLFVVMMYLPPYTTFIPTKGLEQVSENEKRSCQNRKTTFVDHLMLSQLSYLAIFIILICITEGQKMKDDPINFSVLNVVLEVISAYGNVGYTTGYNCDLQLKPDSSCKSAWYGFVGRWSSKGKIILIVVMLLGRLKKFSAKGGIAWKLS